MFLKTSISLFLFRLEITEVQRWAICATVTSAILANSLHLGVVIFGCGNLRYLTQHLLAGRCIGRVVFLSSAFAQAAVSTMTDCIFTLLPIALFRKRITDFKIRSAFCLVLGLGVWCVLRRERSVRLCTDHRSVPLLPLRSSFDTSCRPQSIQTSSLPQQMPRFGQRSSWQQQS